MSLEKLFSKGRRRRFRSLIYWSPTKPPRDLADEVAARGWMLHISMVNECSVRFQSGIVGGILNISEMSSTEIEVASKMCRSTGHVVWIALVRASQLELLEVRILLRRHCFNFLKVPVSGEQIADAVGHAYGMKCLDVPDKPTVLLPKLGIVGQSSAMQRLLRTISRVAKTNAPVLILGETGTGKELTATALHKQSTFCGGPFVAINCGAISAPLMQSELFGYERGAFTGATARKIGFVEAANGGTLFLDEIGDLPHDSQAALLRFLQDGFFYRIGGREPIQANVRIISATHVDLAGAVRSGCFRSDLYHRLCVLRVDQPPLRDRDNDIEMLANLALDRFRNDAWHFVRGFSADGLDAMHRHDWPGNVRELINRVRRALAITEGRWLTATDLDLGHYIDTTVQPISRVVRASEREVIEHALLRSRGHVTACAKSLGVSRATLYRWMAAHDIVNYRG